MKRMGAIARAVVTDSIRRRVPYVVVFFAGVLAAAIPSLPDYGMGIEAAVFREMTLALMYVTAIVMALALAANRLPTEFERRTVYSILAKQVSRREYVVGTWAGLTAVMAGVIAAFTIVIQIIAVLTYGDPMWVLWLGALSILLEMGVIIALAVAVSTLMGPVVVVVATLAILFVGHSRSTLLGGLGAADIGYFAPSLDAFNIMLPVAYGSGVSALAVVSMLTVFVGFVGLALLIAVILLGRRDL
jgi:ABC-type transport system involved in multi-copper enzyme maturation permease subunit